MITLNGIYGEQVCEYKYLGNWIEKQLVLQLSLFRVFSFITSCLILLFYCYFFLLVLFVFIFVFVYTCKSVPQCIVNKGYILNMGLYPASTNRAVMDSDEADRTLGSVVKACMGLAAPLQWDEIICVSIVSDQITRPSAAVVPKPQQVEAIKALG